MKIGPVVSKICPRQIWFHWAFYLVPLGPPGPIFSTPLKVVPMSLKKTFHVNPVETFCKIWTKPSIKLLAAAKKTWLFTYVGHIKGLKDPKIWPLGNNILHFSQSSSSGLKKTNFMRIRWNLLQNRQKHWLLDLILALFGVKKGPKT